MKTSASDSSHHRNNLTTATTSTTASSTNTKPVKVFLRVRPLLKSERDCNTNIVESLDSKSIKIQNIRNHLEKFVFHFDACFGENSSQKQIFDSLCPMVEQILYGMNTTIFCYGITSSGKTFTMDGSPDSPGIIPRAVKFLLTRAEQLKKQSKITPKFHFLFSHLEIYNEKVYDLNSSLVSRKELQLRQDFDGSIVVSDLNRCNIDCFNEFEVLYKKTRENRSTAATLLNSCSSRSHSVLRIEFVWQLEDKSERSTKLNLIDLAGSEDNRKTGNNKDRMIESGNINKSLFMLSQVVDALNSGSPNIPYRNSKLTRLLQDALGGRAICAMICNIAPGSQCYLDTLNTLNIARRTKTIEVEEFKPPLVPQKSLNFTGLSFNSTKRFGETNLNVTKRASDPSSSNTTEKASAIQKKPKNSELHPHSYLIDNPIETIMKVASPATKQGLIKTLEKISRDEVHSSEREAAKVMLRQYKNAEKDDDRSSKENDPRPKNMSLKVESFLDKTIAKKQRKELTSLQEVFNTRSQEQSNEIESNETNIKEETTEKSFNIELTDSELGSLNSELLDILNSGNVKRLTQLKGIGLTRAQYIVDYQKDNGTFKDVSDLLKAGIGDKIYQKVLKDFYEKTRTA